MTETVTPMHTRRNTLRHGLALGLSAALPLAGCGGSDDPVVSTGRVTIDSGQLYYEEAGQGPAVILIHGFTLDTRMWDDQFMTLARRFRTVRYDMRGFGKSTLPTSPYMHLTDIKALMDALRIPKAHIVGFSAGGRVAIDFALIQPAMTDRLVVIDMFVGGYVPTQGYIDSLNAVNAVAQRGDLAGARRLWMQHPLFVPAQSKPDVVRRLEAMVNDYSGFHWTQTNPETRVSPVPTTRLREITMPSLMLVGERDIPDVQTQAQLLIAGIPGLRSVTVPSVGHMSNMEAPEFVNDQLLRFLS